MSKLLLFAVIGFFAQLIDGALGMSYGATSASLLLMFGVAPAVASASIHMAEIATTAASGASHIWFKNVDRAVVLKLIIPGSISAFVGAAFLSSIPGHLMLPFVSVFLMGLGVYILFRFFFRLNHINTDKPARYSSKLLTPLGFIAGFMDAVGGGGWGPITTPVLLSKQGASPRKVIGTVDTSEFAISVSATLGFVIFLGWEQFHWMWVAALVIGGVIAAPIAAWLVKIIPAYLLGVLVGGFIILTNLRTFMHAVPFIPESWIPQTYLILVPLWFVGIAYQIKVNVKKTINQTRLTKDMISQ